MSAHIFISLCLRTRIELLAVLNLHHGTVEVRVLNSFLHAVNISDYVRIIILNLAKQGIGIKALFVCHLHNILLGVSSFGFNTQLDLLGIREEALVQCIGSCRMSSEKVLWRILLSVNYSLDSGPIHHFI